MSASCRNTGFKTFTPLFESPLFERFIKCVKKLREISEKKQIYFFSEHGVVHVTNLEVAVCSAAPANIKVVIGVVIVQYQATSCPLDYWLWVSVHMTRDVVYLADPDVRQTSVIASESRHV